MYMAKSFGVYNKTAELYCRLILKQYIYKDLWIH